MNNLSEYELVNGDKSKTNNDQNSDFPKDPRLGENGSASCYVSADDAAPQQTNRIRESKRGVPWTEKEHKLFLLGLQKVGKGDWRGISKNYVKTRTPTQVTSHAQKYFLRRSSLNHRPRRSSLFDITTESVTAMLIEEVRNSEGSSVPPPTMLSPSVPSTINVFSPVNVGFVPVSMQGEKPNSTLGLTDQGNNLSSMFILPVTSPSTTDLKLNQRFPTEPARLSLKLLLSLGQDRRQMVNW